MFAFCVKNWQKANIGEYTETLNFSVLCGKLQFPPQNQLFFRNTYSDQFFCIFRTGSISMFNEHANTSSSEDETLKKSKLKT